MAAKIAAAIMMHATQANETERPAALDVLVSTPLQLAALLLTSEICPVVAERVAVCDWPNGSV